MKCALCDRRASRVYTFEGREVKICSRCFDRNEIQDVFERRMLEIDQLTRRGDYDAALSVLQTVFDEHVKRDHDGWLKRSFRSARALILTEQGKLREALAELREKSEEGFLEPSELAGHQLEIADTLNRMGQSEEAVRELERGLEVTDRAALSTALSLFVLYARIADREQWTVPTRHRSLLNDVLDWWGLQVSPELINHPSSLASAIIGAHETRLKAQRRYQSLVSELRGTPGDTVENTTAEGMLRAYVDSEPVGYYRELAARKLADFEDESR